MATALQLQAEKNAIEATKVQNEHDRGLSQLSINQGLLEVQRGQLEVAQGELEYKEDMATSQKFANYGNFLKGAGSAISSVTSIGVPKVTTTESSSWNPDTDTITRSKSTQISKSKWR